MLEGLEGKNKIIRGRGKETIDSGFIYDITSTPVKAQNSASFERLSPYEMM